MALHKGIWLKFRANGAAEKLKTATLSRGDFEECYKHLNFFCAAKVAECKSLRYL